MRNEEGRLKPVVLISSDGGPDENPIYATDISHAVHHFVNILSLPHSSANVEPIFSSINLMKTKLRNQSIVGLLHAKSLIGMMTDFGKLLHNVRNYILFTTNIIFLQKI